MIIYDTNIYETRRDGHAVFALYQACFHDTWPLQVDAFHAIISHHGDYRAGDHFVIEKNGCIVGFVATQLRRQEDEPALTGGIALLMVHPQWRRKGIGRQLHDQAISHLKQFDLKHIFLANGSSHRLWQGIPDNLPTAQAFFHTCGWSDDERSQDLVGDVHELKSFAEVTKQRSLPDISIRLAEANDQQAILNFEGREFPHWKAFYQSSLEENQLDDILIAHSQDGEIIAALLLSDWQSPQFKTKFLWHEQFDKRLGALGAVGVAQKWNDQGIGSALVARGAEIIKARDVGCIYIAWTGRASFYERLGYRLWQEYCHMAYEL